MNRRDDMLNELSTAEAAKSVGVDKCSITRAIQAGKINASKNEYGDYRILRSELARYRPRRDTRQQPKTEEAAQAPKVVSINMDELFIRLVSRVVSEFADAMSGDGEDVLEMEARLYRLLEANCSGKAKLAAEFAIEFAKQTKKGADDLRAK
jgi:hypothetical protein